jgi:hypothetical protein
MTMNENEEIEIVDMEKEAEYSKQLLSMILSNESGTMDKVASAGSKMIRRKIRENGFSRVILPHTSVDDSDLTYMLDSELPAIVEEMEPESPGAVSLSYDSHADTAFYRADKFVVYFSKISTPEFTKNVDELRTTKSPLREVITDNALKDVQTHEDERWIQYVDRIIGGPGGVGMAGVTQYHTTPANITRESYIDSTNHLEDLDLNNGVFLMNRKTCKEWLKFGRLEAGGDWSEEMLKNGRKAIAKGRFLDIDHVFTIKRKLVPDNTVYQHAEPDYLGRAYVLQPITMYVEKKKDVLRFSAEEKIGTTIANVAGVARHDFGADT